MLLGGGRLKAGGSRPGATVPWAAGRREWAAEPAAPAAARVGAARSTPSWPAPLAPPSARSPGDRAARLPLSGRPQGPKAPRDGEEPRGTAPAAPPGPGKVEDQEQGRGSPSSNPRPHAPALDSCGKWGKAQVGLKTSALSHQFRPRRDRPRSDHGCSLFQTWRLVGSLNEIVFRAKGPVASG